MRPRRTLASEARVAGRGLFTGVPVAVVFGPGREGGQDGLVFVVNGVRIPATIGHLSARPVIPAFASMPPRHTVLAEGDARAITVEHALAALAGLGITDADITIEGGEELPIGDGSAGAFVSAIASAGLRDTGGGIEPVRIGGRIVVEDGRGGTITAEPGDGIEYVYEMDYAGASALRRQSARWSGDAASFTGGVAPARTFSLRREAEQMRALGLFASFTPRDLLVLDDDGTPIDNTLRYDDEPARHKLLDLIGDLTLAGAPVVGRITASRSGHALAHELVRRLCAEAVAPRSG